MAKKELSLSAHEHLAANINRAVDLLSESVEFLKRSTIPSNAHARSITRLGARLLETRHELHKEWLFQLIDSGKTQQEIAAAKSPYNNGK